MFPLVYKKILLNGLVVLACPMGHVPKVSLQMWYHVGSKDEKSGEKGLAHLIEHMIFKGTDKLSETDYKSTIHKLSGDFGGTTHYDHTKYFINIPSQHWQEGLALLANTMQNARFDQQMLNSELKAVIQELKMNQDDYTRTLMLRMCSAVYYDHPYKYEVIGFKQDLWSLDRDVLFDFYKHHYIPNNAVLVVAGDITPEEVFKEAEHYFGHIPSDSDYKKEEFYHGKDLVSVGVELYRQVQQAEVMIGIELPGLKSFAYWDLSVLVNLLNDRYPLKKTLVDEQQLVTSFSVFPLSCEDATLLFIKYQPKNREDIPAINQLIGQEIDKLKNNIPAKELERAIKQTKHEFCYYQESNESIAYLIGRNYIMAGDENALPQSMNRSQEEIGQSIMTTLQSYFSPAKMHQGKILPFNEGDEKYWQEVQVLSDQEDTRVLEGKVRTSEIEDERYTETICVQDPKEFSFPKAERYTLKNGIQVFAYDDQESEKINIILSLKMRSRDESEDQEGIYNFVSTLLLEGTEKYPGQKLKDELAYNGIRISVNSERIDMSLLPSDLPKSLKILRELVEHAQIDCADVEKKRAIILSQLNNFWDNPDSIAGQLAREMVYKNHPFSKNSLGTFETVKNFTRDELFDFYKKTFSPDGARIAIVGNFSGYDIKKELNKTLGSWKGPKVKKAAMPALTPVAFETKVHVINRDQVVLVFAGASVERLHPDFNKLCLVEQPLSYASKNRLFDLREKTGLCYVIGGFLATGASDQPGMVYLYALVSLDRLEEAKKAIEQVIADGVDTITQEEIDAAKRVLINQRVDWFANNHEIADTFLFLDYYKLDDDYFDKRPEQINKITLKEAQEAARKVLDREKMAVVLVGRVPTEEYEK